MSAVAAVPQEPVVSDPIPERKRSLAELIRSVSANRPDESDWNIAILVLAEIEEEPTAELQLTLPAVSHYVQAVRRGPVRRLEHKLSHGWRPSASKEERTEAAGSLLARMAIYADERLSIPGVEGKVRAGAVTLDAWRERLAMIQEDIDREMGTAEFISQMIALLRKAKVSTIDAYLKARKSS